MVENWFRWHVGTCLDPKWKVVARRSAQPIHLVLAVWAMMLECAAQASIRGTLEGWDDEDVATAIDLDNPDKVSRIREAMQGKVLDGDRITQWSRFRMPGVSDRLPWHLWCELRAAVFERDGYACRYCGATDRPLECDHVMPVSQGGGDEEENLATACRPCNRAKGAKRPDQWRPE